MTTNLTDFDLCAPPFLDVGRFPDDGGCKLAVWKLSQIMANWLPLSY